MIFASVAASLSVASFMPSMVLIGTTIGSGQVQEVFMKYFAGLDVSLQETAICVVDEDGIVVTEGKSLL